MTDHRGSELQYDQGRDNWRWTGFDEGDVVAEPFAHDPDDRSLRTLLRLLGAAMVAAIASQALYRR